jgi:protein-tyrosine phosphatase
VQKEIIAVRPSSSHASSLANFRDFGGQPVGDARRVREGLLFRCGSLTALGAGDHALLDSLGIAAVVDLRSVVERANHPSEWVPIDAATVCSPISDTKVMLHSIFSGELSDPLICHDHFSGFYARIPELYANEFSDMFALLADGTAPLLVNCSAGKDRTGVAAALILSVVGVNKEAIFADYLETQQRLDNVPGFIQMLSGKILKNYAALPEAARTVLIGVHRDHLAAAFAQIDGDYGSVADYLAVRLSVSHNQQDQIRAHLTEKM